MATHSSILVWEISWTEEFGGTVHRVAKELDMIQPLLLLLLSHFSHVRLLATPGTAAYQAPLSMGFSRQEYWSGVPLLSPQRVLRGQKHPEHCVFQVTLTF